MTRDPRLVHAAGPSAGAAFLADGSRVLVVGDRAAEDALRAAALAHLTATRPVAALVFWGRAGGFHADAARDALTRLAPERASLVRALERFEPVDLLDAADALQLEARRSEAALYAHFDRRDALEGAIAAALDEAFQSPSGVA